MSSTAAFLLALTVTSQPPGKTRVDIPIDATVTVVAGVGALLFFLIPVDEESEWDSELLPFDEEVKGNYSSGAASISDVTLASTFIIPMAAQLGMGFDEQLGHNALVYGETLAIGFLLNSAAKFLVQRPRPYVYHPDPAVRDATASSGPGSRLSFYSGHAAMSFTAAVAGSYLFALRSRDPIARAVMWGVELAMATATANLRVRAGKHFYTDVLIGAAAGAAVGFLVPFLHQPGFETYEPRAEEWLAIAGGILVGAAVSQLLPIDATITVPLEGETTLAWRLAPMASENGAGLMIGATY